MKKTAKAWAVVNKRGTILGQLGLTRRESEAQATGFYYGWDDLKENGCRIIPGTFTYDDGRGRKK